MPKPYPAIGNGSQSFIGADYSVNQHIDEVLKNTVRLEHKVSQAPFIEELLSQGKAQYGCFAFANKAGYRRLNISESDVQLVSWDTDIVGESPLLKPAVLYTVVIKNTGSLM